MQTTKYGNYSSNKFYRRNNSKLQLNYKNSDTTGSVVNLNNKTFTKDTFKLLNKCLRSESRIYLRENENKRKAPFLKIASSGTFFCNALLYQEV